MENYDTVVIPEIFLRNDAEKPINVQTNVNDGFQEMQLQYQ